jgi:acetolactate synthase I/II/III large subunit
MTDNEHDTEQGPLGRRSFLKAVGAAAGLGTVGVAQTASAAETARSVPSASSALPPSAEQESREYNGVFSYTPEQQKRYFQENPGSDFMVDVIKAVGIDYIAVNPGTSFRGLQESLVNYGGNSKPELITVNHEGIGATIAHGYFKAAGKPMAVLVHGAVGTQHLPMAVYSAWCDRVPMIVLIGNHNEPAERGGPTDWYHSAQDVPSILRDFTKWDDTCYSLQQFSESMARACKIAMTPPMGPVVLAIDTRMQEEPITGRPPRMPVLSPTVPPQADLNALRQIADWMVAAKNPVIVAGRVAHNQAGIDLLVELAELLQAGVVDQRNRVNFPTSNPLSAGSVGEADVILGLELTGAAPGAGQPGKRVATIGTGDLLISRNVQDFQRYAPVDLSVAGDAQASLPFLIEAVRQRLTRSSRNVIAERGKAWHARWRQQREANLNAMRYGWNTSPVSTGRLYAEIWDQIRERDWSLVSADIFQSSWANKLWPIDRYYQHNGSSGSAGIGYGAPAALGSALAHKKNGVLAVNVQKDGDLMFYPGTLWTAAHHRVPMLTIMHNNRAYHAETMAMQEMCNRRRRGVESGARIATTLDDPPIDFSGVAKAFGMWSSALITDPAQLAPAIREALAVVDSGRPALLDVHCSGR